MLRAKVREGSLDERVGVDLSPETLLEAELRDGDLSKRLGGLELGEPPMSDAVRLDANAAGLELGELVPVERRVLDSQAEECLLVRKGPRVVEVRDRREDDGRKSVLTQDREGVSEVVAVAVVERDQDSSLRKRGAERGSGPSRHQAKRARTRAYRGAPSAPRTRPSER